MDRYWLLSWTTYGTWLPGDQRGFVGELRDVTGGKIIHNTPGTPYDFDIAPLAEFSRSVMKGPPIYLIGEQAIAVLGQFQETSQHRHCELCAAAIMANHAHLVVGVPGDPDPAKLLNDYKAYASRALNRRWGKPSSDTWWTESGSRRILRSDQALLAAIRYVKNQANALVVWVNPKYETII